MRPEKPRSPAPRRPSLVEIRQEMARLTDVLVQKSKQYQKREAQLILQHGENNPNLIAILNNDPLIQLASGASQVSARLAGALAAVISAEIAYRGFVQTAPNALLNKRLPEPGPEDGAHLYLGPIPGSRKQHF